MVTAILSGVLFLALLVSLVIWVNSLINYDWPNFDKDQEEAKKDLF
jgi:hypothetical protein